MPPPLTQHAKFRLATQKLAHVLADADTSEFHERMDIVDELTDGWQRGVRMLLFEETDADEDDESSSVDIDTDETAAESRL